MVNWINYIELENSFEDIEKKLKTELPTDLKKIVETYNKGMPYPNKIDLKNGKFAEFFQLLSFNFNEKLTVYSCMTLEMKKKKMIPFAITKNNNLICLKDSKVFLYNIEHNIDKFICNSFTELIENLQ